MARMFATPPPLADAAAETKLKAESLDIYYGAFQAIKNASLSVPQNCVMALIGPSGCGKSTFIRALNRMHDLTPGARVVGQVLLDGDDIYAPGIDPVTIRHRIGMVFQRPNPFPKIDLRQRRVRPAHPRRAQSKKLLEIANAACATPHFGTRSKIASIAPRSISPAASSSACASRAASRSIPK